MLGIGRDVIPAAIRQAYVVDDLVLRGERRVASAADRASAAISVRDMDIPPVWLFLPSLSSITSASA